MKSTRAPNPAPAARSPLPGGSGHAAATPRPWSGSRSSALLITALLATGAIAEASPAPPRIVVDQFGYLPWADKVAVVRNPQVGFDAGQDFAPGKTYAVVDARTGVTVHSGPLRPWKDGATDPSSGDKAFWFDFSSLATPGRYYILDIEGDVRSAEFDVRPDVYREVLKHAVRTFFYQRAGIEKRPEHAGEGWADRASHLGPRQDRNARAHAARDDARTERDLSGGWYDAGDYNKYTSWTARYVITLLQAYQENPAAFTDDYGIPESGNGVVDVLDEVKWGLDWLVRMQNPDGSVLSILGLSHASPPSAATGPSFYGPASTSATLGTAAALALGSKVFRSVGQTAYADDLLKRARSAYDWADANPEVVFRNNDRTARSEGLGAGQQETDDYGRLHRKIEASVYLFENTGEERYRSFVDKNYEQLRLIADSFAYPFEADEQDTLLYYAGLARASRPVAQRIRSTFDQAMRSDDNLGAIEKARDPYRAYIKDYTWGSTKTKAWQGSMVYQLASSRPDPASRKKLANAALGYVHYLHGVNPLGMAYLTNMAKVGAARSANELYHSWFEDGSADWDRVGTSRYGPPPGFLVGGPNPGYDWDSCCPRSCGLKAIWTCTSENLSPPKGQPPQKSYKDFNTGWPLNSWSVTENSNGYQAAYIRLLSKFVQSDRP